MMEHPEGFCKSIQFLIFIGIENLRGATRSQATEYLVFANSNERDA
jgi:hypothetical protein